MPVISQSSYNPPFGLGNGHIQTVFPTLFRKVPTIVSRRERIATIDGDFLDLDWIHDGISDKLAILSHGLEGSSESVYIKGMAAALSRAGWDVLAWNFRGCGGEMNLRLQSYHSGSTQDLFQVIQHAANSDRYKNITLLGFSMGGNITLKLLGEKEFELPAVVSAAITFSVATNLASCAAQLERLENQVYMKRFLKTLREKIEGKIQNYPDHIIDEGLLQMRTFREFDNAYTAPIHGFLNAEDYWKQSSCGQFIPNISVPTLLVNAINDPFLSTSCYPIDSANNNQNFYLEIPSSGGHMGFIQFNRENIYWSERRALKFLNEKISD